ncbi:MAG: hypothetical protein JWR21_1384 [Herminiimonas sp.]|nr:hypothetical protein [Herminiimonas sp.]MDB5852577.1 hypothetical protein [Herminiimonas sp.]
MADQPASPGNIRVYDPRGRVDAENRTLSARVKDLNGLRLGILDNTKWNANKVLRLVRDELMQRYEFKDVNYYRKESFSRFAAPELIQEIAANNDILLTAIGD